MGVTGARDQVDNRAPEIVARVRAPHRHPRRRRTRRPHGAQAAEIAGYADGVIVGSALVTAAAQGRDALLALTQDLAEGRALGYRGVVTSTASVLAYLPSPSQGVWYVGPAGPARLRALHHRRHRRRDLVGRSSLGRPRRQARHGTRHRRVGRAVRSHRRPALPRRSPTGRNTSARARTLRTR